jgi:XTP/dITP diphosphohydrolase
MVVPGGEEVVVRGEWRGTLLRARRGTNGFGYDPIFVPEGYEITSAEMTAEQKDAESHRGRALKLLVPHLRKLA